MSKIRDALEIGGNGIMYVLTVTQTKEVFELISLILSIAISVLIIVSKLVTWIKKSSADGKITSEEIKDAIDIVNDGVDDIKNKIDKEKKE